MKVTAKNKFFHVRFRSPGRYTTCRVPSWASRVASTVSRGAKTRQCRTRRGEWETQSVMIPRRPGVTKAAARRLARKIVKKIEK